MHTVATPNCSRRCWISSTEARQVCYPFVSLCNALYPFALQGFKHGNEEGYVQDVVDNSHARLAKPFEKNIVPDSERWEQKWKVRDTFPI